MGGFSSNWLSLREAADHRARDRALPDEAISTFPTERAVEILDLGCGTGSNLRALANRLPVGQNWRLIDNDPRLLHEARNALRSWADEIANDEPLALRKEGRSINVRLCESDLTQLDGAALEPADLVTAAALFDLVSQEWIARFAAELARRRLPLYAVLNYNGDERWEPAHPADGDMLRAFHAHQARDKGFGPALGPRAADVLKQMMEAHGYAVATAPSPWRLSSDSEAALIQALAEGAAAAVAETRLVDATRIEDWRRARRAATRVEIGHVDLFAWFRGR
jgi:SAM-dependent methyltransferase